MSSVMDKKFKQKLTDWAIATDPNNPLDKVRPISQQLAFKIYEVLGDGKWWKTDAIATEISRKPSQIRDILQCIKDPWKLESSRRNKEGGGNSRL